MSKSVLIIDTPERCIDCDCFYGDDLDYWVCYPTWEEKDKYAREKPFSPFTDRMPECPLIPLEKVCKMAVDAYKEEEKIKKENTILCDECYKFFDKREVKTITEYSDKWFTDVNEKGYRTDWRYVYIWGKCPHCGKLNLLNYYTESREHDAD